MRSSGDATAAMTSGLARIRTELDLPETFPPEVLAAVDAALARPLGAEHVDRTDRHYATLDPASSVDLDQAFAIEVAGADIVLHYAIADVGWFVEPGDPVDAEAWKRGVTVYLPDGRTPLYPTTLSEGAASLLPDVDRPAVVFTVRVASDGAVALDGVERSLIRSRAKLAYDAVSEADLPPGFAELWRRISAAEVARGADRVEFPEQELEQVDGGRFELTFRARNDAEEQNAAMSLATNMAVADAFVAARTGVFRVMQPVDERQHRRLRNTARAFGLDWPEAMSLAEFERSLPRDDRRTAAFLISVRRASGGAGYAPYVDGETPWHAAVAATYAHATAPLRRLQDRYVVETALAIANGRPVDERIAAAYESLPAAMEHGEAVANRAERFAVDLAEAVALHGREGELFDAVVTDEDNRGARIQIADPAVVGRVSAHRVDPGDAVRVRLVSADPERRTIEFERVG